MSDVSGPPVDDLDPERFITRAKQSWQATADAARADYEAAREPNAIARTAIALSHVLRGPGYRDEADEVIRDAVSRCRPAALRGEPEAVEAVADLVLHAGRSAEAIRLFEEAAAAGSADAMQQIIDVMLDGMLVGAGARVQEVARALPARQRQVLALTGLGTSRDAYAYAGEVLAIPTEEVGRAADRGLAALARVLDPGPIHTRPFDPDSARLAIEDLNIDAPCAPAGSFRTSKIRLTCPVALSAARSPPTSAR